MLCVINGLHKKMLFGKHCCMVNPAISLLKAYHAMCKQFYQCNLLQR